MTQLCVMDVQSENITHIMDKRPAFRVMLEHIRTSIVRAVVNNALRHGGNLRLEQQGV